MLLFNGGCSSTWYLVFPAAILHPVPTRITFGAHHTYILPTRGILGENHRCFAASTKVRLPEQQVGAMRCVVNVSYVSINWITMQHGSMHFRPHVGTM